MTVKLSTNKACGLCNAHKPVDFKAKCVFYITCRSHDSTILEADISGLRSIKALYAKVLVLFILLTLILEDFDSIFALHIHYQAGFDLVYVRFEKFSLSKLLNLKWLGQLNI